jgi:hypothetical protein
MAFLDKFNEWYVRSIPETEQGVVISWIEPLAGAKYRWKKGWPLHGLGIAVFFFAILLTNSRRRFSAMPLETRFWIAIGITAVWCLVIWLNRNSRQSISLTANYVAIGEGRRTQRIPFHEAHLTFETPDGHPVLIVAKPFESPERIYLDPARKQEITELLTQAGRLAPPANASI